MKETLEISQDTFRHWKDTLAPLSGRNGYRPCFTLSDLLAMAIIKALAESAGIRVGALQRIASSLFGLCGNSTWGMLESVIVVIKLEESKVIAMPETGQLRIHNTSTVVPLRPIIRGLRDRLLMEQDGEARGVLRFPRAGYGVGRRSRKAGGE